MFKEPICEFQFQSFFTLSIAPNLVSGQIESAST
jgi:hypothetical protein